MSMPCLRRSALTGSHRVVALQIARNTLRHCRLRINRTFRIIFDILMQKIV